MSVDTDILSDMWLTIQEYINPTDIQIAADHVINVMSDHNISEHELKAFAGVEEHLKAAVDEYFGEDENDDENDEHDEYE